MSYKSFQEMLKKVFLAIFIAAAISCSAGARVDLNGEEPGTLQPNAAQSVIVKDLVSLFETVHYKKVPFNDSLSSEIYDVYIKTLDEGKNYFLKSDIQSFEQYRPVLLKDLTEGDLSAMFHIFNVYQTRYLERLNYAVSLVDTEFDFTKDEEYIYNRKDEDWFGSEEEAEDTWRKRVKYDMLTLKIREEEGKEDRQKRIETLTDRYNNLISQAEKTNNDDAFQIIMNAFTGAIDPHTNYFNPSFAQAFNEDMARTFEGIGARLMMDNEVVKISEVLPGGPAFKDKTLQVDDRIIGVAQGDDEFVDIVGWRLDNAVSKIKGPKGTVVRLKIIPAGQELTSQPTIVSLTRDKIVMEESSAKKETKTVTGQDGKTYKVGVIKIPGFYIDFEAYNAKDPNYKSTTRDVKLILDTLKQENVDAILVDLRGNGGGSLMEAIELTGLFIKSGPVVQVRDTRNRIEVDSDDDPSILWDGPMGVMIDRFSASASEIFAGAIQDYGRGLILGTQSYGKGTVQSAIDMARVISPANRLLLKAQSSTATNDAELLADGAPAFGQINITMAKFYRITGSSTQHKGVIPDIKFPMIYPADKFGESSEPAALPWDQINATKYSPVADLGPIIDSLNISHESRMEKSPEYENLLEDIAYLKEREGETSVSLQETKLRAERAENEKRSKARREARQASLGLPEDSEEGSTTDVDFIEEESLKVMADMIGLIS
ncbi:carboxy terminal-processing peptidase [Albibacterium profundi]|uniref:Carboxy terminal-processing peptidase n=1 Tax=Albibacterium profundi TaxID=3134906 RepID=A0ABV5CD77_9SPHI